MFNIFKSNKDKNTKETPRNNGELSARANNEPLEETKKQPVHGTNGVWCGGCGGEE